MFQYLHTPEVQHPNQQQIHITHTHLTIIEPSVHRLQGVVIKVEDS